MSYVCSYRNVILIDHDVAYSPTQCIFILFIYLFIYLFIHSFAIIILEECVSSSGAWVLLVGWLLSFIALVSLIN